MPPAKATDPAMYGYGGILTRPVAVSCDVGREEAGLKDSGLLTIEIFRRRGPNFFFYNP
jgi:hypothetical protein